MLPNETFTLVYFDYAETLLKIHGRRDASSRGNKKRRLGLQTQTRRRRAHPLHHAPWIAFTSFSHARRWGREDSVPKISFGKFIKENDRTLLPFSVEVHHSLMDGLHVGRYIARIEEMLAQPETFLDLNAQTHRSSFSCSRLLGGATAFWSTVLRARPLPTPIGWKAHVTTVAGDGSPAFRDGKQSGFSDPFGVAVAQRRNDLCC